MTRTNHPHYTGTCQVGDDQIWQQLYDMLHSNLQPSIVYWVYSSGVASWRGQESDIIEDILQETVIRTHRHMQQVEQGNKLPIISLTGFSRKIALNHFKDLRRKEGRLARFSLSEEGGKEISLVILRDEVDPAEIALETLIHTSQITVAVNIIANLPRKQRTALLIDLANLAHESGKDGQLQAAFLRVGISLLDYHQDLPTDPAERGRHAALLSLAYKRLRQRFSTKD